MPSRIRVRPFHLIKELAKRHKVHVIALGVPSGEKAEGVEELWEVTEDFRVVPHSGLRGLCQSLAALGTPTPMCTAYAGSGAMRREVAQALRKTSFDLVHVEHLRAAQFAPLGSGLPVVFDSVDCLAGLYRQMAQRRSSPAAKLVAAEEAWKLKRHEPRTLSRFDGIVITSESERDALLSLDGSLNVDVVPNGVDVQYFSPTEVARSPHRIVFSGKMGYAPNREAAIWFAEQVFPAVRDKFPEAEFVIVGNDPPESVKRLASSPGITVTGYVADLRPHLESSAVAVAPMQVAVGVQNKVLEAMAMGLPVIMSPLAARSLEDCDSRLVARDPEEWSRQVTRLLEHPDEAASIGARNRGFVTEKSSWQSSAAILESVYDRAMARRLK